jgi:hypothetical protein
MNEVPILRQAQDERISVLQSLLGLSLSKPMGDAQ